MRMIVNITDSKGAGGSFLAFSPSAGLRGPAMDINNWRTLQAPPWPFGIQVRSGECLFDSGSLFIFDGPMNSDADNVVVVLWSFPSNPDDADTGDGVLNK